MNCIFCRTKTNVDTADKYWKCPSCGTTQESSLNNKPYKYTVGNHSHYEAPHVKVGKNV